MEPLIDKQSELQAVMKNDAVFPPNPDSPKPERRLSGSTASLSHDLESQDDPQDWINEEQCNTKANILFSLFGQMLAAIVVLIAATSSPELEGSSPWRQLAAIVAGVTLVFIIVGTTVTLAQIGETVWLRSAWTGTITPSKIVAYVMVCWWHIWVCVFTFHKPFGLSTLWAEEEQWKAYPHWAGFFGCWGGVICATTTLVLVLYVKKPHDQHQIRNHQAQQVVPFILLTAIVQLIADLDKLFATHPRHAARFRYCLIVSASTIVVSLAVVLVGHRIKSTWWKFGVWPFALLWITVPLLVGFSGPFANEGKNGFWSAWFGCLLFLDWSVQLMVKELSPSGRFQTRPGRTRRNCQNLWLMALRLIMYCTDMKNKQPAQVNNGARAEEDSTSESKDHLPSPFSDRTTWLGEVSPSNTGDLETPLLEGEPSPTEDEMDQTQDTKPTVTIAMGLIVQVLASIVIFFAANTSHHLQWQRHARRLAATIGIVTLVLVGLGVTCRTLKKGVKVSSSILTVWWFVWATFFTTRWPFVPPSLDRWYSWDYQDFWPSHYHWAGYFACWGGAVCSLVTLLATLRSDLDRRKPTLTHRMLPYIILAALIQVLAASIHLAKHGKRYPGRTLFALVVGGLTLLASLIVQFCVPSKFCIPGKLVPLWVLRVGVFLFALLWMTLGLVVTTGPFADGSNGFWSAWGGFLVFCFWLVRLSRRGESDSLAEEVSKRDVVVWFVGQALAAFLILVESTSQQQLVGNRPDRHLAAVISSITLLLLLVSVGLNMMNHDGRHCQSISWWFGGTGLKSLQVAAGSLMLWWFCWASVFTITPFGPPPVDGSWRNDRNGHGPYEEFWRSRPHWTGFVACWGGVVCSIAALSATVEPEGRRRSPPSQQEQGVPYIILAAMVQMLAVVQAYENHGTRYAGRLIYSLVVSALTIIVAVAISCLIPTPYQLTRFCLVFLFALLWTALALSTTPVRPFSEEVANGFWSAWCGCLLFWFWLCRLRQHSSQQISPSKICSRSGGIEQ